MSRVSYTDAPTQAEMTHIAANMRAADVTELRHLGREDPLSAVTQSAARADEVYLAYFDGQPAAIFGVGRMAVLGNVGVPWFLGTDDVPRAARLMVVDANMAVASWRRKYGLLQNTVSVKNTVSVRWLTRLGFEFGPAFTTPFGGTAMTFTMKGTRDV